MTSQPMTLLIIISETVLEDILIDEIMDLGAKGYTITDARGRGTHGTRAGRWTQGGNIRIEIVGNAALCERIVQRLQSAYEQDYGLLMYTAPVELQN
nr:transcriptional regulator [Thioalkalivibrio sp.]